MWRGLYWDSVRGRREGEEEQQNSGYLKHPQQFYGCFLSSRSAGRPPPRQKQAGQGTLARCDHTSPTALPLHGWLYHSVPSSPPLTISTEGTGTQDPTESTHQCLVLKFHSCRKCTPGNIPPSHASAYRHELERLMAWTISAAIGVVSISGTE